jgi:tRNA U54 and U55 pseudouridine synthase Pus10
MSKKNKIKYEKNVKVDVENRVVEITITKTIVEYERNKLDREIPQWIADMYG